MKITEKLSLDINGLIEHGAINIVIFGDSVSHGSFNGYHDYDAVYHNLLRRKLNKLRDTIPVNMINSAIGGTTAKASLKRLERDVFSHHPDLVIVCFGLNDVNGTKEEYLSSLEEIFAKCKEASDVIFLTPNMLNTYVADGTPAQFFDYAHKTADMQNSGRMDDYIYSAKDLALLMGVPVCDCYSIWKEKAKTEDTTMLLCNRINHPNEEMHKLFADELFKTIMG